MTIKNNEVLCEGIVLSSKDYRESDVLISVYTKDFGKMAMVARGVKKMKSKNAGAVGTITKSEFDFLARKGLSSLIKASSLEYYRYIKENLILEAYASYIVEYIYKYTHDNEPDEYIYHQLDQALDCLENGYDYRLVYLLYNAFILRDNGSPLQVDQCVYCGQHDQIMGISYTGGGFVCRHCIGQNDRVCSKELLQAFRHINKLSFERIDEIHIDESLYGELTEIMDYFVDEYTGVMLKSRKFIRELIKM